MSAEKAGVLLFFCNVKKFGKHTLRQRFAEPAGAREEGYLFFAFENFPNQIGFIGIEKPLGNCLPNESIPITGFYVITNDSFLTRRKCPFVIIDPFFLP